AGRVTRIGTLPAATTHAAAAAIGGIVFVVGGRGASVGSASTAVVAIDVARKRIYSAGRLATARSDLAAVAVGSRILVAGGRTPTGTSATISALSQAPRSTSSAATPHSIDSADVYAHDGANRLSGAARRARELIYVPNSRSDTVDVIDPHTYKVVEHFAVGGL